jgi:hypothetical protein
MTDEIDLQAVVLQMMNNADYQMTGHENARYGTCDSCPGAARDSRSCLSCITKALGYIVGTRKANGYILAQQYALQMREELLRSVQIQRGAGTL